VVWKACFTPYKAKGGDWRLLNYQLSQKLKLIENGKFNYLINILAFHLMWDKKTRRLF
jgi:hypothetical protein